MIQVLNLKPLLFSIIAAVTLTCSGRQDIHETAASDSSAASLLSSRAGELRLRNAERSTFLLPATDVHVGKNETLSGSGVTVGQLRVEGTLVPGENGDYGELAVLGDIILVDGAVLDIHLMHNGKSGGSYSAVRSGGIVYLPTSGSVTVRMIGEPGHNIEGADTFEVISGRLANANPENILVDNRTSWSGQWKISCTDRGLLITATEKPLSAKNEKSAGSLRVLFVGDSITGSSAESFIGYARHVMTARPDWEVRVVGATTSQALLDRLRKNSRRYGEYDVIYVNIGLHSIRADRFEDIATFEDNLSQIADILKSIDAKVIWRTTTPIAKRASGNRDYAQVSVYNDVAVKIMNARGIEVDDMYEHLMPFYHEDSTRGGKYLVSDGTHWSTGAQRDIIAPRVIETIRRNEQ